MAEEMSITNDLLKKLQDKLVDIMEQKEFQRESINWALDREYNHHEQVLYDIWAKEQMIAKRLQDCKDRNEQVLEACRKKILSLADKRFEAYDNYFKIKSHLESEKARIEGLLDEEYIHVISQYKAHGGDMEIIKSLYNDNKKNEGGKYKWLKKKK